MVVPVPGSTSKVDRLHSVALGVKTLSIFQIISLVAFVTISVFSMSFAVVRNGNTNVIRVESPSFGTSQTFKIFPVPTSTSKIRRVHFVRGRVDTLSFGKIISSETGETVSGSLVESVTL